MISVVSAVEWDHFQGPSSSGLAAIWVLMGASHAKFWKDFGLRKNYQVKQILVFWVEDKNKVDFLLHANKLGDALATLCWTEVTPVRIRVTA